MNPQGHELDNDIPKVMNWKTIKSNTIPIHTPADFFL